MEIGSRNGHPECSGIAWGQTFLDVPRSMWFMFVTVSTVGYGDVSPATWQGQTFVCQCRRVGSRRLRDGEPRRAALRVVAHALRTA